MKPKRTRQSTYQYQLTQERARNPPFFPDPIDCSKSVYQKNALCFLKGEKFPDRPKIDYFSYKGYRGLGVSMARSFFANAMFFTCFEFLKKQIKMADGMAAAAANMNQISK